MKNTYQVIPRRYRPQFFFEVVGQQAVVQTLKNALKFQRLAQAYLFCGSRGTGKTTLARLFAKALNCQNLQTDFEPCGKCSSCEEIASSRSLDVIEIDGASNRGIDDIRQLNETVGYATHSCKYKIYIIDEVHMLTKEAFNALLKTLEEPPKTVKFFFATTEPHKVLPTIISRCQRFDLQRIPLEQIKDKLQKIAEEMQLVVESSALHHIAILAEGSLRDAESLLDQIICYGQNPIKQETVEQALGLFPRAHFFALDEAISKNDLSFAFELSQKVYLSGTDFSAFTDALLEHFRQLLLLKTTKPQLHALSDDEKNTYQKSAQLYTKQQCLYILDSLLQWQQTLTKSVHKRIYLEMLLIQLIRSAHQITIDNLVQRLIELEGVLDQRNTNELDSLSIAPIVIEETKKAEMETPATPQEQIDLAAPTSPELPKISNTSAPMEEEAKETLPDRSTAPSAETPISLSTSSQQTSKVHPSKYDTLIRFAAVELEGTITQKGR